MTKHEFKCSAIAIGRVVAARDALDEAIQGVRFNGFSGNDVGKLEEARKLVNNVVTGLNLELEYEDVAK